MKVIVASYKYTGKPLNWLISAYTGIFNPMSDPSSHVEMVMPMMGKYMCFSSTNRDGAKGTRWEDPQKVFKHPDRWKFYEKEYTDEQILDMVKKADSILDLPYDWWGIAGFGTLFGQVLNDKEKWYCSEACWFMIDKWIKRISPRRFCVWIVTKLKFRPVRYLTIMDLFS